MNKNKQHLKNSIDLISSSFEEIKKAKFKPNIDEDLDLIFDRIGFHNTLLIDILNNIENE
jgi:hypothetical protein